MADSDVIGGIENLTDAVSGETPSYEYKNPNTDMMKAISKCVDAATGETGTEYEYDNPNTDVIQKMEELAEAIASSGGGGGSGVKTIKLYKGKIKNSTGVISEDNDYYYTDFFPCSTDLTFDLGITGQPDYEGLTLYKEDKTYSNWYNPLSRYRNIQPPSSEKWCRLSFKASKSEYPLVHDWVNNIVYTTETPVKFSDSSGGSNLDSILEAGVVSTSSDYATATFNDISDYTQIICRLYKDGDFYYQILNVSDIPETGELNSNFMSPSGADFSISRTSVRLTYYTGGFRTIYMDIVGTKKIIFPHVYT